MAKIKERCEQLYKQIADAQDELKEIRSKCKHENTFEGKYSWRVGCIEDATICDDCGECAKIYRPEFITTSAGTELPVTIPK